MTPIPIDQAIKDAVEHHRSGHLGEAETIYRQVLAVEPRHPAALHLLGVLASQLGRCEVAVELMGRSVSVAPNNPDVYNNLGNALRMLGRFDEAIGACRRAIELDPAFGEAFNNLGNALMDKGALEEAIEAFREAIRWRPESAPIHGHLGNALSRAGRADGAIVAYREAVRLNPASAPAWSDLGNSLRNCGRLEEAIEACRRAIALEPGLAIAHNNLGCALAAAEEPDAAVTAFRQALLLEPDLAEAHGNLAATLASVGLIGEARVSFIRAMQLTPGDSRLHSTWLYLSHYDPERSAADILREHREWGERHARPLQRFVRPHGNDPSPDRGLRIGYVSPDFLRHPVGCNFLPPFREHDREQFEIFCYANSGRRDAVTDEYRSHSDGWRNIVGVPDGEVAEVIRADRIDILVDLASHTIGNRLLVLARKPAPVQVTHFGAWSSTGLEAIDYRLSDPYLDPAGTDLSCYLEETIRLPRSIWFYDPDPAMPAISPLPALAAGFVTFSCRNSFAKVSTPAFDLWLEILLAVPKSRLLLQVPVGSRRTVFRQRLEARGLAPERVEFLAKKEPWQEFLRSYHQVDLALDPFPYCGWTSSCDALWMGVPVVSLCGETAMGRGGCTILSNIGLPELVAKTPREYVKIAVALANDWPRLSELRSSLRARIARSPIQDAAGMARDLEAAYRKMWRKWCANHT